MQRRRILLFSWFLASRQSNGQKRGPKWDVEMLFKWWCHSKDKRGGTNDLNEGFTLLFPYPLYNQVKIDQSLETKSLSLYHHHHRSIYMFLVPQQSPFSSSAFVCCLFYFLSFLACRKFKFFQSALCLSSMVGKIWYPMKRHGVGLCFETVRTQNHYTSPNTTLCNSNTDNRAVA